VVEAMHVLWQDAPIYTSVYDKKNTFASFANMDVRTTFMQKMPFAANAKFNKLFLPIYPMAFESMDMRGFDVVLSHGTRFAHGVITAPETCHLYYCHTPTRFAWRYHEYVAEGNFPRWQQQVLPPIVHRLRMWDYLAVQRVDYLFANSYNIARRIQKFYGRKSDVLYPPVETNRFHVTAHPSEDYFLVVSRLLPYKRVDLAVEACTQLGARLKVVGVGPDLDRLKSLAGPTVEFLGRAPDGQVEELFANCRAFFFPGEEDFGIAPVEAMSAGRPVIALRAGGAMETVIEGRTGLFFDVPTVEAVKDAMRRLEHMTVDPARIRQHAESFDTKVFHARLQMLVETRMAEYRSRFDSRVPKVPEDVG
jgi:glycosyltransferase involved in cell wall biosynthesis